MTHDHDAQNVVIIGEVRRSLQDVIAVYRFGSSAHGSTRPGSDIDLAILPRRRLPSEVRFDLQERLAGALDRDVDLLDLSDASPVLAIQVVAHGLLLYDGDVAARGAFEDRMFSAYARLNEERRGILERIAAEGTVLGR